MEIRMPEVRKQHEKTPAWIREAKEHMNPETGHSEVSFQKKRFTTGTGEDMWVLRWPEAIDDVENFVENKTLAEVSQFHKKITGEAYEGINTKKEIVIALLNFWFGFTEKMILPFWSGLSDEMVIPEMFTWARERIEEEGRWGLGCPHSCGRFWEFKPSKDLTSFRPVDDTAMTGIDEEGEATKGYLEWTPQQEAGVIKFKCDRCGKEITLRGN